MNHEITITATSDSLLDKKLNKRKKLLEVKTIDISNLELMIKAGKNIIFELMNIRYPTSNDDL